MKLKVVIAFLSLLSLNLCLGQTDSADKTTITKIQELKADTINVSDKKSDIVQEPKKNNKKDSVKVAKKNVSSDNGLGASEVFAPAPIDTVKYLKDSIRALNKAIFILGKEKKELREKNEDLQSQIIEQSGERDNKSQRGNWRDWVLKIIYNILKVFVVIFIFIIPYFILNNRKKLGNFAKRIQQLFQMKKNKKILVPSKSQTESYIQSTNIQTKKITPSFEKTSLKSFSNVNYSHVKSEIERDFWFVVGASSIGKAHISSSMPCQDNHFCSSIKEGWGIAVSCDGAGSAVNSHWGSEFVAEAAFGIFKDFLLLNKFVDNNKLPNQEEWQSISNLAFKSIYNLLSDFVKEKKIEFSSIACTVSVVVYTPFGLLATHIGDGRAGYCNANGEWKSLIIPHKGEEANQTIFLTSSPWVSTTDFKMSEVLVPECRVINEKVIAFTLMSDGCESHSFDCSKMDNELNKWIDPNLPSEKFFIPLVKQLKSMYENKVPINDITSSWHKFLESGTPGLKNEADDKTLILGILI